MRTLELKAKRSKVEPVHLDTSREFSLMLSYGRRISGPCRYIDDHTHCYKIGF